MNIYKLKSKLFLTTSLIAFLSTSALATKQITDAVKEDFSSQKVSHKLWNTNDYLLHLDVNEEAKRIGKDTKQRMKKPLPLATLESEAKTAILAELIAMRQELRESGGFKKIGNIPFTLNFRNGDLSVAFSNTPLVYPCLYADDREKPDAFLPAFYASNFMSKALCDHIRTYSQSLGLDEKDAQRLNKYLQPLFYLVQREASSLLDGTVAKNLYHSPRWVYTKSYEQMQESLQRQAEHHLAMLSQANIRGLNEAQVTHGLTAELLGLGMSFLPNSNRILHQDRGMIYVLGRNINGHVSLLNPYADNLPYPVLKEQRLVPRSNIPHNFVRNAASYKQWRRADEFIDLSDYHFSEQEKHTMKRLVEGIGTLFHKHLSTFHVQRFPIDDEHDALTEAMARSFAEENTIPEPYLTQFYQRDIDPDIHRVLAGIKNKGDTHRSLTSDLWPARFDTEERKTAVINEAIKFLMFKDILDRATEYNAYRNVARLGPIMRR